MTNRSEAWPGKAQRALARSLVERLDPTETGLTWNGVDLRPGAEHALYTALLRSSAERARTSTIRAVGRVLSGTVQRSPATVPRRGRTGVVALVTQPIHATLFVAVASILRDTGVESLVIDAETRRGRAVSHPSVAARLMAFASWRHAESLVAHAMRNAMATPRVLRAWIDVLEAERAEALAVILQRALGLLALDAARVDAMLDRLDPDAIVCFSESGTLARVAPAVARRRGVPVIDLPHAEANDPWGSAGIEYDAVLVYGPRARAAIETAGYDAGRIVEIGPLRYDELLSRPITAPNMEPRRVVFASQPSDANRPALHPDVKRTALRAALTAGQALAPSELVVVPHPTEPAGEAERFVAALPVDRSLAVRVERDRGLHEILPGSWVLVTASSQSVFEAIISGVPAITVHPPGTPAHVSFADEGISIGIATLEEMARIATRLATAPARAVYADSQRTALGNRVGPLDGRAAVRAADILAKLAMARRMSRAERHDG